MIAVRATFAGFPTSMRCWYLAFMSGFELCSDEGWHVEGLAYVGTGRDEELFDIGEKSLAIDWAVEQAGPSMRSERKAARKVAVFQSPMRRLPRGAQP